MPTKAAPKTTAEWDHYLSGLDTPEKFTTAMADGTFKDSLNGYVEAQNKERVDIQAQVTEQVQATMTDFFKENAKDVNRLDLDVAKKAGNKPSTQFNNKRASGAPLDGVYPDFYTFLQDIWNAKRGQLTDKEAIARYEKVQNYSERVPSEGGLLVPEEFRTQLQQLAMENSVMRPGATVIPMQNPRLHIPSVDESSRVSSVFGGVVVYRTEEGQELTESAAVFQSIKLDVTKQTALAHVPNELIRDWGAFGAFIDATLPAAMGFYEDIDFLSGSGAGQPLGALSSANTALIVLAAAVNQGTATIAWENIIGMYARMLPSSINKAVWLASPDTFVQLATMALSVGTGGSAIWLTNGQNAPVLTLLGRPVIMTEKAPGVLGAQGDLSFIDRSMYLIGDYQTVTIDSSPHVKFTSDKTSFRAIARNDGRPWITSAITPHNNSVSLSPFVQLAARP